MGSLGNRRYRFLVIVRNSIPPELLVKTVKLSSKGQVTLPVDALRAIKAKKGDEFVLIQDEDRLVLIPAAKAGRKLVDDLAGWETMSEAAFREVWDSPEDEVWNDA